MAIELSEVLEQPRVVADWANKVFYNVELSEAEREISEAADAWAREIGKTGHDRDHEISALIQKALTNDVVNTPSELISRIFNEEAIDEFDDWRGDVDPKNTIKAYEAIIEGNVDRSHIEHTRVAPTWKTLAAETDITMQDLRRGGYRTVANLINFIQEALEMKKVNMIFTAADSTITSGNDNYIAETTAFPTEASTDKLALYLLDITEGDKPLMFMLNKYLQKISKLAQAERWPTDAQKTIYTADGFLRDYAGCSLMGFQGQRKLADGNLLVPNQRVFGVAGKIGSAITRGDARVMQEEDINTERIHVKVAGYTFGYSIYKPELLAKMVMAS